MISVLGRHSKDKKSTQDKSNMGNPKLNSGCPPLTANRTSAGCDENSLWPSIQYIPLGVYHTGGFNAMNADISFIFYSFISSDNRRNIEK